MEMYKPGQKVVFIDEPGEGKILEIRSKGFYLIEDEYGFQREYPGHKIAPIRIPGEKLSTIQHVPKENTSPVQKRTPPKHNSRPVVIDLHIHELVERYEHWTNTEIVNYQMEFLKKQLDVLMKKRVRVVHIIHGVGEGVLRSEVRKFLRKFVDCEINDMSYTPKGFGATEFIIRYKGNV
jgi:hypothetical protein